MSNEAKLEALKAEADKLGYKLVRKSAVKLESCSCNNKKPYKISKFKAGQEYIIFRCKECKKTSEEKISEFDATEAWNAIAKDE